MQTETTCGDLPVVASTRTVPSRDIRLWIYARCARYEALTIWNGQVAMAREGRKALAPTYRLGEYEPK